MSAHHCNARDILQIVYTALDMPPALPQPSPFLVLGPISQARSWKTRYYTLGQYLLLLEEDDDFRIQEPRRLCTPNILHVEHHVTSMEARVLEYCIMEVNKTRDRWSEACELSIQNITSGMMRIVTDLCIVASALAGLSDPRDRRVSALESSTSSIVQSFVNTLSQPQTEQYKIDAVLETYTKNLPYLSSFDEFDMKVFRRVGVDVLSRHLSKALGNRIDIKPIILRGGG